MAPAYTSFAGTEQSAGISSGCGDVWRGCCPGRHLARGDCAAVFEVLAAERAASSGLLALLLPQLSKWLHTEIAGPREEKLACAEESVQTYISVCAVRTLNDSMGTVQLNDQASDELSADRATSPAHPMAGTSVTHIGERNPSQLSGDPDLKPDFDKTR